MYHIYPIIRLLVLYRATFFVVDSGLVADLEDHSARFHRRALSDRDHRVPERVPAGLPGPSEAAVVAVASVRQNSASSSPTAPSLPP
jgi:hypothetical protein